MARREGWLLVGMLGLNAVSAGCQPATCGSDADCEAGQACDEALGTCQAAAGSTSGGSASSAVTSGALSSSGVVGSSSRPLSSSGPVRACPDQCAGANVMAWDCENDSGRLPGEDVHRGVWGLQ